MALKQANARTNSSSLPSALRKPAQLIRPSVKVPVLSVQSRLTSPRFWIELRFFTITFFSSKRRAPALIARVVMAGKSSGAIPTARARENRAASTTPLWLKKFRIRMTRERTSVMRMRKKPNSRRPFSNPVSKG